MLILKFGGSSVANAERIRGVMEIISKSLKKNREIAVVVSAFGGITDKLIETAKTAASGNDEYIVMLHHIEKVHYDALDELAEKDWEIREYLKLMLVELSDILKGVYLLH